MGNNERYGIGGILTQGMSIIVLWQLWLPWLMGNSERYGIGVILTQGRSIMVLCTEYCSTVASVVTFPDGMK